METWAINVGRPGQGWRMVSDIRDGMTVMACQSCHSTDQLNNHVHAAQMQQQQLQQIQMQQMQQQHATQAVQQTPSSQVCYSVQSNAVKPEQHITRLSSVGVRTVRSCSINMTHDCECLVCEVSDCNPDY
jgi:hypothetical protein